MAILKLKRLLRGIAGRVSLLLYYRLHQFIVLGQTKAPHFIFLGTLFSYDFEKLARERRIFTEFSGKLLPLVETRSFNGKWLN